MRRKLIPAFLFFFLLAAPAAAQRTVVTGTVTDPNGIPYAGGSISATLSLPLGASGATLNGVQISGTSPRTSLDSNGAFLFQLPDNNVVVPAGTRWVFSVSSTGVLPPVGFGPRSFVSGSILITGASQDISATLSALAPALTRITATVPAGSAGSVQLNIAGALGSLGGLFVSGTELVCHVQLGCSDILSGKYSTLSPCNTNSNPGVCGFSSAGTQIVIAATTTGTVNTTAVTSTSQILLTRNDGATIGSTCNTATVAGEIKETSRVAGTSFTFSVQTAPVATGYCISWLIVN